ncbi:MAG TPA: DUF371 domain-containing protein [Candidatus Bathyarchaeia archaeon]|nr:DUF371 domain-containing protein [Candidatus Bathyarchaeia archaeon]
MGRYPGPLPMSFVIYARGHPEVLSTHRTTLEITKGSSLTKEGNCIIAVQASAGLADLPRELKAAISSSKSRVSLVLDVNGDSFTVEGRGDVSLSLSHPDAIVVRKSTFISDRTLMVKADKAAFDVPRRIVTMLQDPNQQVTITISAVRRGEPL